MVRGKELPIIHGRAVSGPLTRREMVRRMLTGVGAGVAWPLVATSHSIHELLNNDAVFAEAENLGAPDWKPLFLSAQENETLAALAESVVPGSTNAQVNRFIDLLLSVDTAESQKRFRTSLTAFEAEAQKRFEKEFPALDASQKNALLTEASAKPAGENSLDASASEKHSALHGHFENLKEWVTMAYYSSEAGMRELGWKGEYAFESFPGCKHPEGHN